MGLAVSLLIAAAGLILALAVHPAHTGSVDVNTVGWILFVVGLVGLVLDLLLWSSVGPGYMRRRYTSTQGPGYPATPAAAGYPPSRRRVVEEEDVAGPPGY